MQIKIKKKKNKIKKKRLKKKERQAKIANKQRAYTKKPMKRKKFKINWKKIYTIIINFRKSNLFINLQEVHGLSRHWTSMGMLGFKRRKRNRVQSVIYQYIKFQQSISNIGDFNPFLVWNGVPKRRNYRAIVKGVRYSKRKWNKISWRGSIAMTNLSFNGCRRKKLKRK